MPNPWDAGTAKVLAWLGFEAASELRDHGTYGYHERAALGAEGVREAFGPDGSDPSDTRLSSH